jgi:hypothetical protein
MAFLAMALPFFGSTIMVFKVRKIHPILIPGSSLEAKNNDFIWMSKHSLNKSGFYRKDWYN